MGFVVYLDESGTHAGSPISAMAGFVGDARQWRKFEKRAGNLFKRFGVSVFHAIDVRRGHKDFDGWTVDRKIEFQDEFQHIINETLESGVVAFIRDDDCKYYSDLYWPKKAPRDTKYTIMFRACLAHIVNVIGHIPQAIEPRLRVVLEDGHVNKNDALRNFQMVRERLPQAKRALAGLTFGNKANCLPLAAADLFAYVAWGERVGQKPLGIAKARIKSEASYRSNMFWIDLNRDSLDSLHEQAIEIHTGAEPGSIRRALLGKLSGMRS